MFNPKCNRCGEKLSKGFGFCPYCGFKIEKKKDGLLDEIEDGMLDDFMSMKMPLGFEGIFRQLDKQLRGLENGINIGGKEKNNNAVKKFSGLSITISSSDNKTPRIEVKTIGNPKERTYQKREEVFAHNTFPQDEQEKLRKLPRIEPETKVRRLTDKVIYELTLEGVDSIKNVVVNRLANSIEIKAFAKDKAYSKLIPVSLPLNRYYLKEGRLFLELNPN